MSERKLKGLLAPTTLQSKDTSHSTISVRKSASPSPSPTIASNSHRSTPNVKPHGTPVYYEIPGVQNFFYNPISKNETDPQPQPSPWVGSIKLKSLKDLPPVCQASAHTAADTHADQTANPSQFDNDCSNSLYDLVRRLNLQAPSQPKNLEELLQRSFASMPSHSILQSPHGSAFPSPFIRSHTSTLMLQAGSVTDLSLRASFVQKSPFSASQNFKNKLNPTTTDEGLITQIANLINQESDGRIRTAITELLTQYSNPNLPQKGNLQGEGDLLSGRGNQELYQLHHGQPGLLDNINMLGDSGFPKPKTISLSNGMKMNAVNRSPKTMPVVPAANAYKSTLQNTKVEAARKELFVISESAEKKPHVAPPKSEANDFNLFGATHGEPISSISQALSPLISTGSALKQNLHSSLFSQTFSSTTQPSSQSTGLFTSNLTSQENPSGSIFGKKNPFELTGKFQVSSAFKLSEDIQLNIPDGESNGRNSNKKAAVVGKSKTANKKLRMKNKKVSVEDYVKHAHAQSIDKSNLTIEETWEDEDSWDDVDPQPQGKNKDKSISNKK